MGARTLAASTLTASTLAASTLAEHASDLLCLVNEDGTLTYVNPASRSILGHDAEVLIGRRFFEFLHPEDVPEAKKALKRSGIFFEARWRHQDGRWVSLEAATGTSSESGIVLSARDVTERRKEREALRQSQKMEAIGRLANGVAHDFNNLLTAINGYSELLLARLDGEDPQRRALGEIRKAGRRAAEITRRLLIVSRHQNVAPRRLDLNQVTTDMEKLLKRVIGEDVDLHSHLDINLRPIHADLSQIEQIILNLVINAKDAMAEPGQIIIETHSVTITDPPGAGQPMQLEPGDYAQLVISDSGGGMPPGVLEHAFEPFFTTKDGRHNAGLGLAIVYGIVKQAGGHVGIESEDGLGTSIRLYLPHLLETRPEPLTEEPALVASEGQEMVLLVEDETPVRDLVRQILELGNYLVEEACDGETALEVCEGLKSEPDVLLTDVVMPGISGIELADSLRQRFPRMKILFMSGYTDSHAEIRRLARLGATFLPKPFTPNELTRRLRDLLEGRLRHDLG